MATPVLWLYRPCRNSFGIFYLYLVMMVIDNEFEFGDIVYLKTDKEQSPRIITCIMCYKAGELMYKAVCGTIASDHYGYEISKEVNVLLSTTH